jgi:ligand-binding SRPBCC domain-containing protein
MDTIRLSTWIAAPVERCFLLSLSIDLHVASARLSREEAIDGVTTGLIGEGETVTFQGRHFGMVLRHTSRIDAMRPYTFFCDAMVAGIFPRFIHEHHFATMNDGTRMRDEVRFSAPWGIVGELATKMYVRRHLTALLTERNAMIKRVAESEEWHKYLDGRSMPIPSCAPVQTAVTPRLGAQRLAAGLAGITDLE